VSLDREPGGSGGEIQDEPWRVARRGTSQPQVSTGCHHAGPHLTLSDRTRRPWTSRFRADSPTQPRPTGIALRDHHPRVGGSSPSSGMATQSGISSLSRPS
jgi:hypothetical protein